MFKERKIFKEANYIITNPADNDNLVHRGAVATPMAYALKNLGETMTDSTYPDPYAKWNTGVQVGRWTSNIIFAASLPAKVVHIKGYAITIPTKLIKGKMTQSAIASILDFLASLDSKIIESIAKDESLTKISDIIEAFPTECGLLAPSADLVSLCIIGRPLNVQNKDFWRDLWNEYGNDHLIKTAMKSTLPINLVHNLAIASGTWSHATFKSWAEFNGKPFSEILYANMNGHSPLMPKSHYENALFKAQCEGTWHAGMSSDGNQGEYTGHLPWHSDNVFADDNNENLDSNRWQRVLHGIDYMLMYNMYRMAEINHWQNGSGTPTANRTQCPCKTYPSMRYTNYTPSILEEPSTANVSVDGRTYNNAEVMVPKNSIFSETRVV